MKLTSATANKEIKRLMDEKDYILDLEEEAKTYVVIEGEEEEKPEYDYKKVQNRIEDIDEKICKLRHAINMFNTTTTLENVNVTIDAALIKMAMLNVQKKKLNKMRRTPAKKKSRDRYYGGTTERIEYQFTNYNIKDVEADYDRITKEIAELQIELDKANQTIVFEVDIDNCD